jgi:hypothetical protein
MSRRVAFGRIELIALLAVGWMCTMLLLPALAQNREAAARSQSANNLKMIALAIHNYNDALGFKLPPLTDHAPNAPFGAGLNSLFFNILPYLEHDKEFRLFRKDTPSYCGPNGVASKTIKEFISPADTTAPKGVTTTIKVKVADAPAPFLKEFEGTYATTSYAANGLVFGSNNGGLPRTFVDGTSNTIMFGERAQVCGGGKAPEARGGDESASADDGTVYNLWAFGAYGTGTPSYALLGPTETKSTGQVSPVVPLPKNWTKDPVKVRIGHKDSKPAEPPKGVPFQVLGGKDKVSCVPGTLQTPHPTGMLIALGDGSVRSVSPKISQWTFWAATTPAGNETLGLDW